MWHLYGSKSHLLHLSVCIKRFYNSSLSTLIIESSYAFLLVYVNECQIKLLFELPLFPYIQPGFLFTCHPWMTPTPTACFLPGPILFLDVRKPSSQRNGCDLGAFRHTEVGKQSSSAVFRFPKNVGIALLILQDQGGNYIQVCVAAEHLSGLPVCSYLRASTCLVNPWRHLGSRLLGLAFPLAQVYRRSCLPAWFKGVFASLCQDFYFVVVSLLSFLLLLLSLFPSPFLLPPFFHIILFLSHLIFFISFIVSFFLLVSLLASLSLSLSLSLS